VLADIPADCLMVVEPLLTVLAQATEQIKGMEATWCGAAKRIIPPPRGSSRFRASARSPPCASS